MFVYGIPKFSHGEVMQSQLFFESKLQYKHRNPVRASIGINQKLQGKRIKISITTLNWLKNRFI
jgi:hypothetical protein